MGGTTCTAIPGSGVATGMVSIPRVGLSYYGFRVALSSFFIPKSLEEGE